MAIDFINKYALFCNLHLDFEKTYSIMKIDFTIKLCIIEAIQSFDLSVLNAIESSLKCGFLDFSPCLSGI